MSTKTMSMNSAYTESPPMASYVIKVGIVGDAQIGKTTLMVKYVDGHYETEYTHTLGVDFMEKTLVIYRPEGRTEVTFSIWDLGGQREFLSMLPLVSNDAHAILFMFDLTRKSTLNSVKEWYRQGRGLNKMAQPFLIGTKYDEFVHSSPEDHEEVTRQARKFARAMKAPLIFCSAAESINVQTIYKIVFAKTFDLGISLPEITQVGGPIVEFRYC